MTRKIYNIYRSEAAAFDEALDELLAAAIGADETVVRIVLFGAPKDNEEYATQRAAIEERCKEHFGSHSPMVA